MKKLPFVAALVVLPLIGCASQQPKTIFIRTDGQRLESNPTFQQLLDDDLSACRDRPATSLLSGLVGSVNRGDACMLERGYVEVPKDQAEAKRAEIATKRDQERIANLPPIPDKPAPAVRRRAVRTAAKPKKLLAKQEARPAKQKKPPLTNPLKLED